MPWQNVVNPAHPPQVQTPEGRRVVGVVREMFGVSGRRACRVRGFHRSTQRHRSTKDNRDVAGKLRTLACKRPRFGARRLHVLLRRQGEVVNQGRALRVHRDEGLALRNKTRRKGVAQTRRPRGVAHTGQRALELRSHHSFNSRMADD